MTTCIELRAGTLRLALRPDLGGAIAGLWLGDGETALPVLRSTEPAALEHVHDAACFPLAPYSNRLGHRRFRFGGEDHVLAPAPGDDGPHALHGVAWQRPWEPVRSAAAEAELRLVHAPDAQWPFAFACRQRFVLTPDALELHGEIENTAPRPQPVGLGWHPYFPRRPRSRLHAELSDRWETDATGLPTRRVPQPGIDGDVVHLAFDHCFEGWNGVARLRDERLALRLSSSLRYLVVHTPAQQPYYCVEPVSHVPNAIHMADPAAHGLRVLQPGERFDAWLRLEVGSVR